MRYYRFLVLAIASLLYCNLGFAYDWAEVDGLRYEYIEYEQGYRLVSIVGYSSDIPENLSIPSSLKIKKFNGTCVPTEIASGALSGCTKLKSIFTNTVREIKNNAFVNCTSLHKITLGASCRSIGSKAFTGCIALDTINYVSGVTIADDAFDESTFQKAKLIVEDEFREECNNHEVWSKFQHKIYNYSISLDVSYGSVYYNGEIVNNNSKVFSELEGRSITLSFTPEQGRELANLIVDGEDVTSEVVNNQFTIDNVNKSMNIRVSFFSINISAKGNGHVLCKKGSVYQDPTTGLEQGDTRNGTNLYFVPLTTSYTNLYFFVYPDDGYQLTKVVRDGVDITSQVYIYNNLLSDEIKYSTSYEFTFEEIPPVIYSLSITSIGNGLVSYNETIIREGEKTFSVEEGNSVIMSFTPDAGYRIKSVKVNGVDVSLMVSDNKYTIENINADTSLEVEFEPVLHTLTIISSGFGEVSYNGVSVHDKTQSFNVVDGTSPTITFTPEAGYRIANVKLEGTDVTASVVNNTYTISSISADMTLSVTFEAIPTYTLSVSSSGNGVAYFNNTTIRNKTEIFTVNEGTSATLTFTPDAGYRISSVKLNNADVTASVANNSYTISNITVNTTLAVTFEIIPPTTYTFTISSVGNGSVTYDGNTVKGKTSSFTVVEGTNAVVTFSADDGYRLKSVMLDDMDVTSSVANNQYTISNIQANTSLEVVFEAISTYSLSITASGNGSATYNDTSVRGKTQTFTVIEGTSATVTFAPDAGYRIANVKLNNTDVTVSVANNSYTISNIMANTTLAVTFEVIPPTTYTFTISAAGNGSVTYDGNTVRGKSSSFTVVEGTNAIVSFSADDGNRLKSVKLGNIDITSSVVNNQYTISNIQANTSLEVIFEAIPTYTLNILATGNGKVSYDGTNIRNQSQSFTVKEGSSAVLTITPDAGYRIANVKKDNADVTGQISDGKLTINNITSNTSVEVTFEAIPPTTYTLTIKATGNGTATYDGTSVRGKSSQFTITEGTYATVTFTPDTDNRIKSVKVNSEDVTSSISDGKYTISSIKENTNIEVVFEAIPTYSLNILATGNGKVGYDGTNIRNQSQSFTVKEGSSAVLTITPDAGYRVANVKRDNTDVTGQISDGKLTINNITSNTSVEVTFEAIPPTTYTLTIKSTGNGAATYEGTSVRGKSSQFTITEGSYATVIFTPDTDNRIKSVKVLPALSTESIL